VQCQVHVLVASMVSASTVDGSTGFSKKISISAPDLSNKRAITVLDYINHRGIVRRRIVAKGYGATKDQTATKEEGRRVELRIVDLNALTSVAN
jgi:hypothetical protein